jgi:acetyl esterase/lipase
MIAIPGGIGDSNSYKNLFKHNETSVIDFVNRLQAAGNQVEFHLIPGMFHAGELFNPEATISKTLWQRRFNAIIGAFNRG